MSPMSADGVATIEMLSWIVTAVVWMVIAAFTADVAANKGGNGVIWFAAGFVFGPLALLAACGMPDLKLQRTMADVLEELRRDRLR